MLPNTAEALLIDATIAEAEIAGTLSLANLEKASELDPQW